jgi:hypothetical protein
LGPSEGRGVLAKIGGLVPYRPMSLIMMNGNWGVGTGGVESLLPPAA